MLAKRSRAAARTQSAIRAGLAARDRQAWATGPRAETGIWALPVPPASSRRSATPRVRAVAQPGTPGRRAITRARARLPGTLARSTARAQPQSGMPRVRAGQPAIRDPARRRAPAGRLVMARVPAFRRTPILPMALAMARTQPRAPAGRPTAQRPRAHRQASRPRVPVQPSTSALPGKRGRPRRIHSRRGLPRHKHPHRGHPLRIRPIGRRPRRLRLIRGRPCRHRLTPGHPHP